MFVDKGLIFFRGICILIGDCYENLDFKGMKLYGKMLGIGVGILEEGIFFLDFNMCKLVLFVLVFFCGL